MHRKTFRSTCASAIVAASLLAHGFAFAEMDGDFPERNASPAVQYPREGARQPEAHPAPNRAVPERGESYRADRNGPAPRDQVFRDGRWSARNVGPVYQLNIAGQRFLVGDRLPSEYSRSRFVVNDWQHRNLAAPRRGQQWIQTGDNYALVSTSTGRIVQILFPS